MNLRSHFYSKFANDHRIIDFVKLKCCSYCEKCNTGRTMKCSRITLFDRKEIQTKNFTHKHSCYYERTFQPQLENYLSWLNKPYNTFDEEQPYLTVCNIALPNNVMVLVDRGAQSDRWVHKRPRLRSAMQRKPARKSLQKFDGNDDDDEKTHNSEEEKDSEIMEIQQVLQEYEIDENVQRLIQEAADYDRKIEEQLTENPNDQEETNKRKHKKHKTKETRNNDTKERAKVRLNRTMTVSLSRPPSPETIQVIRVDVTSNYSMDELNHSLRRRKTNSNDDSDDDDDGNEENSDDFYDDDEPESTEADDNEFRNERQTGNEKAHARNQQLVDNNATSNRLCTRKTLMKIEGFSAELTVQCQKLALADRRSDVNVN